MCVCGLGGAFPKPTAPHFQRISPVASWDPSSTLFQFLFISWGGPRGRRVSKPQAVQLFFWNRGFVKKSPQYKHWRPKSSGVLQTPEAGGSAKKALVARTSGVFRVSRVACRQTTQQMVQALTRIITVGKGDRNSFQFRDPCEAVPRAHQSGVNWLQPTWGVKIRG